MKTSKKSTLFGLILLAVFIFTSCGVNKSIVPVAVNTVKSVTLSELNLTSADYNVLNTIKSEATIIAVVKSKKAQIIEKNQEFTLEYEKAKIGGLILKKFDGVVRLGYLNNTYSKTEINYFIPEELAIRLASYRAINLVQQYGADGLIEPVIATNVEQQGDRIIYKTTVSGKLVKIKTK